MEHKKCFFILKRLGHCDLSEWNDVYSAVTLFVFNSLMQGKVVELCNLMYLTYMSLTGSISNKTTEHVSSAVKENWQDV